MEYDKLKE